MTANPSVWNSVAIADPSSPANVLKPQADGTLVVSPNIDTGALVTFNAASAGVVSADQSNPGGDGIKLVIDITAITGTSPTLTVTLQGKDTASGKYYTILASAALSSVSTTILTVFPGLTAAANVTANDILPRTWRISTVIGGTTPAVTATIGASVV